MTYLTSNLRGGTGQHLRSLATHLAGGRWDPLILSTDPTTESRRSPPVTVAYGQPGRFHRFPVAQLRELAWIRRHLERGPGEILHTYFYWPIVYGRLLKAVGLVETLVENREDEGFNWGEREYRMLRATRSLPDRVVAVSRGVKELVAQRERIEPEGIEIVHNAIDDPDPVPRARVRELRERYGLDEEAPVIGFLGNFGRPVKGLSYLLEAVPLVTERVPAARFFILGSGPDEYRREAERLGVGDAVTFTGFTEEVHAHYELFDLTVLPSLSEGLSLTLLESMAHALPVVATDVGGNPEVVEDGVTGYLVPPEDSRSLAERLVELARNPERRAELGRRGRERAEAAFLQPAAAERYARLYDGLAGGSE